MKADYDAKKKKWGDAKCDEYAGSFDTLAADLGLSDSMGDMLGGSVWLTSAFGFSLALWVLLMK